MRADALEALGLACLPEKALVGRLGRELVILAESRLPPTPCWPGPEAARRLVARAGIQGAEQGRLSRVVYSEMLRQALLREDRARVRRSRSQEWFHGEGARETLKEVREARSAGAEVELIPGLKLFRIREGGGSWRPVSWRRRHDVPVPSNAWRSGGRP